MHTYNTNTHTVRKKYILGYQSSVMCVCVCVCRTRSSILHPERMRHTYASRLPKVCHVCVFYTDAPEQIR